MYFIEIREPVNAMSHAAGMALALPVTWFLWKQCRIMDDRCLHETQTSTSLYQRIKAFSLLVFGMSLTFCYGVSASFHSASQGGTALPTLQRLDHIGIFLLIAGTYTPIAWALLSGVWRNITLAAVWFVAIVCVLRICFFGVLPIWIATIVYLAMGWSSLFCYLKLTKTYSHRTLFPLFLGGVLYSSGAAINLAHWPILAPGIFGSHELFHFFVIAGSASHVYFMLSVVIPAREPDFDRRTEYLPQPTNLCSTGRGHTTGPMLSS
jgi:hemolysin III